MAPARFTALNARWPGLRDQLRPVALRMERYPRAAPVCKTSDNRQSCCSAEMRQPCAISDRRLLAASRFVASPVSGRLAESLGRPRTGEKTPLRTWNNAGAQHSCCKRRQTRAPQRSLSAVTIELAGGSAPRSLRPRRRNGPSCGHRRAAFRRRQLHRFDWALYCTGPRIGQPTRLHFT